MWPGTVPSPVTLRVRRRWFSGLRERASLTADSGTPASLPGVVS